MSKTLIEQLADEAGHLIALAQFADSCCDKPEDRMWHAVDNTWWRRVGNGWVSAQPPPLNAWRKEDPSWADR